MIQGQPHGLDILERRLTVLPIPGRPTCSRRSLTRRRLYYESVRAWLSAVSKMTYTCVLPPPPPSLINFIGPFFSGCSLCTMSYKSLVNV